jgi:hypothetical protein
MKAQKMFINRDPANLEELPQLPNHTRPLT